MALAAIQNQSVQSLPDAKKDASNVLDFFARSTRGPILEEYGTQRRQDQLLLIYRNEYNWAVQGAFANTGKVIATTPWQVEGPDGSDFGIDYWQDIFNNADFGLGWSSLIMKGVIDYLRYDRGWFFEVIGPGNPQRELTGAVTGIAHLDSRRCLPTGDPEFPVIYVDRENTMHRLHASRVIQQIDAPDGDERKPGYGLCALSRAVSIAKREIDMGKYIEAFLDDKPPPGVVLTSMSREKFEQHARLFVDTQNTDLPPEWGRQLFLYGVTPEFDVQFETKAFQQPPEKFDFEQYVARIDMPALALAMGLDVQDLWQLTGGNLGSGTQSEVLHQKSVGKLIGTLRTNIERAINFNILPEDYEFSFTFRDTQEDQARATTANIWLNAINTASPNLMEDETRRLIAGVDDRFHDVMTDDSGELVERDDVDVKPEDSDDDVTRSENEQTEADDDGATDPDVSERTRQLDADLDRSQHADPATQAKDFQSTRLNFENDWADLITAAKGEMPRRRFRTVARALLRRHGLQAFKDGLEDGGVIVDVLEDEDQAMYGAWLASRSSFIGGLADRIYKAGEDVNADSSADMWANNSLNEVYFDGLTSARANGMFEFAGEDGLESCRTCKRLKGQRHRMKTWVRRRLRPGVDIDNFECGGWHCNHTLILTTERASGRL